MTVTTPTPDDGDNEVVKSAENIILLEAQSAALEATFVLAMQVGLWLKKWRSVMTQGDVSAEAFSDEWVEHAAMTIFEKFFTPFHPPFPNMKDDDDDDD